MVKSRSPVTFNTLINKLTLRVVTIALLLFAVCVLIFQAWLFKQNVDDRLSVTASVLSANVTAALEFEDSEQADLVLSTLKSEPDVIRATLYDRNGRIVALYQRAEFIAGHNVSPIDFPENDLENWLDDNVQQTTKPVFLQNQQIGSIQVVASAGQFYIQWFIGLIVIIVIAFFAGWLSLLNTSHVRKNIIAPISDLANAMDRVVSDEDFSVRIHSESIKEVEKLSDSFNFMLANIQRRDNTVTEQNRQLAQSNRDLTDALNEVTQAKKTADQLLLGKSKKISCAVNHARLLLQSVVRTLKTLSINSDDPKFDTLITILEGRVSELDCIIEQMDVNKLPTGVDAK